MFAVILGVAASAQASTTLAAGSRPGRPEALGTLSGVTCTSAAGCIAVGETQGAAFGTALAEHWGGRGWTTMQAPLKNNDTGLASVTCPRPDLCQAAGSAGIDKWNGRSWAPETTAALSKKRAPSFTSVSCPTATFCMAVGQRGFHTTGLPLGETWNGSTWVLHDPVTPSGAIEAGLSSVSCVSKTDCLAVGSYSPSANNIADLAESWNGTSWTLLSPPSAFSLSAVTCTSATSCIAVGSQPAIAMSWNGTAWTTLPAPAFGPTAIWCASASSCMAVGGASAASWNGTAWTSLSVPGSPGLKGVSCLRMSACMAVGNATDNASFSLWWNGSKWQAHRVSQLDESAAVWCTRASDCQAVGGYFTPTDAQATLATSWNGSSWRLRPAATRPGGYLADVSCVSASDCMAVGGYDVDKTLAERWNGSTWRVTPTPDAANDYYEYGVSCKAAKCLAVGRQLTAEWWNGSAWRAETAPTPHPSAAIEFSDVSCATASYCLAVGFYYPSVQSNASSYAVLWNGTKFRLLTPPGAGLSSVSCVSTSFCMAISGTDNSVSSNTAEIWNGKTWRTAASLRGTFGYGPGITGVSCAAKSACMAVGNYITSGGPQGYQTFNVAQWWNGKSWRVLTPAGAGGGLADVSCTSPTRCMAAGSVQSGLVTEHTMAQLWNGSRWQLLTTPNP